MIDSFTFVSHDAYILVEEKIGNKIKVYILSFFSLCNCLYSLSSQGFFYQSRIVVNIM